jgi:hypothetical protein
MVVAVAKYEGTKSIAFQLHHLLAHALTLLQPHIFNLSKLYRGQRWGYWFLCTTVRDYLIFLIKAKVDGHIRLADTGYGAMKWLRRKL